jgi:hypothetical protein
LNVDPFAEFHISLYTKDELVFLLNDSGFDIQKMYSAFWASFLVHPDEFYPKLSKHNDFFFLKNINRLLYYLKKATHPYSTALAEIYGLAEMVTLGSYLEAQGYVVLGRKMG